MNVNVEPVSPVMERLSAYIFEALRAEPPAEVVEKGKHHLLDTVAAMVSGARLKPGRIAISYVDSLGGAPQCTVIGSKTLNNPVNAALANGMHGHADETDDSHLGARFHPGCGVVPGALAAAELKGRSGADLLKAVILGYDVGVRFNYSMGPRKVYSGGHSTHSVGTLFGASAAAAALMQETQLQVQHQLSYTVQQASGVQCWIRDDQHIEKAFDFGGMTARNALSAATMVAHGCTGVDDALSGYLNFFSAFADDPQPDALIDGLGSRWEILEASIKKWCVGSPCQAVLDAVTILMETEGLSADDVEAITLEMPDDRAHLVDNRPMPNVNVQQLVSLALVDRGLTFEAAHDYDRMNDPAVQEIRRRIDLVYSPELTEARPARQAIMSVRTKSGRELRHHTIAVKGTPANRMTRDEVVAKARDLMEPHVGQETSDRLIDSLLNIETLKDLSSLRPLLQA
ncbi:MmgE/PrpD family protein [Lutibaculum baratangense]|uniref:Immune-responsive protein 1 n=1 Tax=Lutibaculum baratangense AMV1 TaxID=631454 RepID=V4R3T6_9HYPH|nr:MmgE/PrpD family protein [Lutibaculum baratangense]ESR26617.1 Immune-responsive protein 1 [Lutibaculum baratangense AMV1]